MIQGTEPAPFHWPHPAQSVAADASVTYEDKLNDSGNDSKLLGIIRISSFSEKTPGERRKREIMRAHTPPPSAFAAPASLARAPGRGE